MLSVLATPIQLKEQGFEIVPVARITSLPDKIPTHSKRLNELAASSQEVPLDVH